MTLRNQLLSLHVLLQSRREKLCTHIEREGLSLIFGLTHFHKYLFGQKFTTDHKLLLGLLHQHKPISSFASARIQRWPSFFPIISTNLNIKRENFMLMLMVLVVCRCPHHLSVCQYLRKMSSLYQW